MLVGSTRRAIVSAVTFGVLGCAAVGAVLLSSGTPSPALSIAYVKPEAALPAALEIAPAPPSPEPSETPNIPPGPPITSAEVLALVKKYFPAEEVGNAMAVARCESRFANSVGAANDDGTRDWGVFQINDGGTLQTALTTIKVPFDSLEQAQRAALDAETNVRAARAVHLDRGWAPWTCAYKVGIVAALYSSEPGPTVGQFDEQGLPVTATPSPAPSPTELPVEVSTPPPSPSPNPIAPAPPTQTPTPETPVSSSPEAVSEAAVAS